MFGPDTSPRRGAYESITASSNRREYSLPRRAIICRDLDDLRHSFAARGAEKNLSPQAERLLGLDPKANH